MSRFQLATTAAALALTCAVSTPAHAQDGGFYQPLLSDFHVLSDDSKGSNNDVLNNQFIQFGKVFTAGVNYIDNDNRDDFFSTGVSFKPPLGNKDELVIATSYVKSQDRRPAGGLDLDDQFELQAKYTLANSLSFGGGYYKTGVKNGPFDSDIYFARLSYDVPFAGGKVAVSPLFVRQPSNDDKAGLFAVYTNKSLLIGGGTDGEQSRGVINFAFPKFGVLKPAAEVIRIDGTVGSNDTTLNFDTQDFNGSKITFFAGTLDFSGGFLAQVNSVGRASGPEAIYYNNPVSFTSSSWNRGYDVWEFGKLANVRILSAKVGQFKQTNYSTAIYPFQIARGTQIDDPLQRIFVGYRHISDGFSGINTDEPILGYFGTLFDKFSASLSLTYDAHQSSTDIVLGLVYLH